MRSYLGYFVWEFKNEEHENASLRMKEWDCVNIMHIIFIYKLENVENLTNWGKSGKCGNECKI